MTDVTLTARFLALSRLKRKHGSTAKVWVSQVLTRRALLEDTKLPTPILLPETLYLELAVSPMSHQETALFEFPGIGDDLNERDRSGEFKWTLERLHVVIDRCSTPPQFRGFKTAITELLEQEETKPFRKQPQIIITTKTIRRSYRLAPLKGQKQRHQPSAQHTSYLALSWPY